MGYVQSLMAKNEQIVFVTRQHWIVLLIPLLVYLLPAIVVTAGLLLLSIVFVLPPVLLALVLPLILLGKFIMIALRWWNEQYIITNRRVVQTEGLIHKHVIDSSLEKVNDVVLDQSIWGRLMGFGNVEILTASEIGVNRLDKIGRPVHFKTAMLDQKEALNVSEDFGARAERVLDAAPAAAAADIPELIAELDELRKKGILSEAEFEQKKQELLGKM
jgi:uncharacterized membrane protein YdbT with pleckstrin-like domain